jgi:hypothetical protein
MHGLRSRSHDDDEESVLSKQSFLNQGGRHDKINDMGFSYDSYEEINNKKRQQQSYPTITPTTSYFETKPSEALLLSFCLLSFSYTCAWTSLGSLISYYKHTYSPAMYNNIYVAYYLPGLPAALLQYKYDIHLDCRLGTQKANYLRGYSCFGIMIITILSMLILDNESALIIMFSILGLCCSFLHGTASQFAALFPSRAIGYLQTGFRTPEVFTIIAVAVLHIGTYLDIYSSILKTFLAFVL